MCFVVWFGFIYLFFKPREAEGPGRGEIVREWDIP